MNEKPSAVLIPQEYYERFVRYTLMVADVEEMEKQSPEMSKNAIYTAIGAKYGVSISAVILAMQKCSEEVVAVKPL